MGTRLAQGECDLRDTAEWAHPRGPGTQLANAASTSRAPHAEQKGTTKGEGSVRTAKPAPSEYPHATAFRIPARYGLGQICGAETKPARFASGLWVDPPEGGVDWVWLLGYEEGVRERDEAC